MEVQRQLRLLLPGRASGLGVDAQQMVQPFQVAQQLRDVFFPGVGVHDKMLTLAAHPLGDSAVLGDYLYALRIRRAGLLGVGGAGREEAQGGAECARQESDLHESLFVDLWVTVASALIAAGPRIH